MNMISCLRNCATLGPIGYLPGSGTIASLVTIPLVLFLHFYLPYWYMLVVILGYLMSYYCIAQIASTFREKDPSEIVIDEVIGCLITFYALPFSYPVWIAAFILFRLFDIYKIGIIKLIDKSPRVSCIILDDVLAGLFSNLSVRFFLLIINFMQQ